MSKNFSLGKFNREHSGNDLRVILFVSRNKDNSHLDSFKERKKAFLAYLNGYNIPEWLEEEFNDFVSRHPDAQVWLAYNALQSPKAEKYLDMRFPGSGYLPLRIEPVKNLFWKVSSFFITRLGLASIYPTGRILRLGQQEYSRYFGDVSFDQVFIQSTDNLQTIAFCAAAAPKVNCTLKQPDSDVTFAQRRQLAFARRLTKATVK